MSRFYLYICFSDRHTKFLFFSFWIIFYFPPAGFLFICSYHDMIPALIKLFNVVAVKPGEQLLDYKSLNAGAVKCGYFVMPEACTMDVVDFLSDQQTNFNATFLKSWDDVRNLSEVELCLAQLLHYFSTYGTDFTAPTFTLNQVPASPDYTRLKVIRACTERELFDRIAAMLSSGVPISKDTMAPLMEQVSEYYNRYQWTININDVRNREAQARLCKIYNTLPDSPIAILRLMVYNAIEDTQIIKNTDTFNALCANAAKLRNEFSSLSDDRMRGLASIFYRYKPIFLAIRQGFKRYLKDSCVPGTPIADDIAVCISKINRIRKMAVRLHSPMRIGVLESLFKGHSIDEIRDAVAAEPSIFKLVKLLAYIDYERTPHPMNFYIIRNGKAFFKEARRTAVPEKYMDEAYAIIRERIINHLKSKAVDADGKYLSVKFPNIELAAPVSERQMIGSVPYGSSYTLSTNNYIGIYWRNEWGTHDFDLWIHQIDGTSIGWSAAHKNEDILFSGDMTNADPEATEIFYGRKSWPDSTVTVSRYFGQENSRFRLFFGRDEIKELPQNYMVNPDSIEFAEDLVSTTRQMKVALICDGKVYFSAFSGGETRVPSQNLAVNSITAIAARLRSYQALKPLLMEAGFTKFVADADNPDARPGLDLTALEKDTLINLFS